METLPLNPMQPYIDHIRSMGVEGRITIWCHAYPTGNDWTVWIDDTNKQMSADSWPGLVMKIRQRLNEHQIDVIALGM